MKDDKTKKGKPDSTRISKQRWERTYWQQKWGISPQQLSGAIRAVGTSVKKVERYLKDKGRI